MNATLRLSQAKDDLWRNLSLSPSTFSRCQCDRGNGRGGGPCVLCCVDAIAEIVGRENAERYEKKVREIRAVEIEFYEKAKDMDNAN